MVIMAACPARYLRLFGRPSACADVDPPAGGATDEDSIKEGPVEAAVAQKNQGPGIQSAAGLIRYFDAEEKSSVKIPPLAIYLFGIASGLAVILMRVFWRL